MGQHGASQTKQGQCCMGSCLPKAYLLKSGVIGIGWIAGSTYLPTIPIQVCVGFAQPNGQSQRLGLLLAEAVAWARPCLYKGCWTWGKHYVPLGVAWNGTWCAVLARLAPHCWPRNWSRHSCPTAHWIECLLPWKKLQAQGGWAVARHSEFVFWTCNWIQAKEPDPWGFEQRQGKTSQYSSNLERPCSSDSSFDSIAANPDSKAFWGRHRAPSGLWQAGQVPGPNLCQHGDQWYKIFTQAGGQSGWPVHGLGKACLEKR